MLYIIRLVSWDPFVNSINGSNHGQKHTRLENKAYVLNFKVVWILQIFHTFFHTWFQWFFSNILNIPNRIRYFIEILFSLEVIFRFPLRNKDMKSKDKNSCNVLLEVKWYFRKGIAPLVSAYISYLWKMKNMTWKWGELSQFLGLPSYLRGLDRTGATGAWHPQNFEMYILAPAKFWVLLNKQSQWHPENLWHIILWHPWIEISNKAPA